MVRFLIFGILGIFGQVLASATRKSISTRSLSFDGDANIVLFPVFGLIAILYPLIAINMGNLPWYGRGAVYVIAFYAVQFVTGLLLTKINLCPWKYSGSSLGGFIRVSDAPIWFISGFLIEWCYPAVKHISQSY